MLLPARAGVTVVSPQRSSRIPLSVRKSTRGSHILVGELNLQLAPGLGERYGGEEDTQERVCELESLLVCELLRDLLDQMETQETRIRVNRQLRQDRLYIYPLLPPVSGVGDGGTVLLFRRGRPDRLLL